MQLEYEVEHKLNWNEYEDWIIDSPTPNQMTNRFIETYKEMNETEFKEFVSHLVKNHAPF